MEVTSSSMSMEMPPDQREEGDALLSALRAQEAALLRELEKSN